MPLREQSLSLEWRRRIAETLFNAKPMPGAFWLGLSAALPGERRRDTDNSLTLEALEAGEIFGTSGYVRQRLTAGQWRVEVNGSRVRIVGSPVGFANLTDERWPTVRTWFLSDSQMRGGALVGWSELQAERLLVSGDVLTITPEVVF